MKERRRRPGKEDENQPLKRIIFEDEDGTVRYLEGNQARIWLKIMDNFISLDLARTGEQPSELKSLRWKKGSNLGKII